MLRLLRARPVLLARPVIAIRPTLALPRTSSSTALPRLASVCSSSSSSSSAPRRAMGSYGGGHGAGLSWNATQAERGDHIRASWRDSWESYRATVVKRQFDDAKVSTKAAETSADAKAAPAAATAFLHSLPDESAEERVGYVLEQCDDGIERVDFVPDNLGVVHDRILINGEEVIIPEMHGSLDWVLSSPMDLHTFEEAPAVKDHESEHDEVEEGKPEAAKH